MFSKATLFVLLAACASSIAEKDDSYYNANSGNPNMDLKMYWKDSDNIMQDLDKFSGLYVEFHSCVWSWMKKDLSEEEEVEENDYWYMGSVPPMGANVAFSLYGALENQRFKGCSGDTFINSFYTNSGFTDFARSMYYAGISGFSDYTGGNADDDGYSGLTAQCSGGYGVGCDANGFGLHSYSSSECDPQKYSGTTDNLSSLNSAMNSAQCIQIYDKSTFAGYDYVYGTPLELMAYSTACNYMNFESPDGKCPDPYGKIRYYVANFNKGIQSKREDPWEVHHRKMRRAKVMAGVGFAFLAIAGLLYWSEKTKFTDRVIKAKSIDDVCPDTANMVKGGFATKIVDDNVTKTTTEDEADISNKESVPSASSQEQVAPTDAAEEPGPAPSAGAEDEGDIRPSLSAPLPMARTHTSYDNVECQEDEFVRVGEKPSEEDIVTAQSHDSVIPTKGKAGRFLGALNPLKGKKSPKEEGDGVTRDD